MSRRNNLLSLTIVSGDGGDGNSHGDDGSEELHLETWWFGLK